MPKTKKPTKIVAEEINGSEVLLKLEVTLGKNTSEEAIETLISNLRLLHKISQEYDKELKKVKINKRLIRLTRIDYT